MENVLKIKDLKVSFDIYDGTVQAVRGVSFQIQEGEILAIVGESGCGKSVTAQSVLRLNESSSVTTTAELLQLCGVDILNGSEKEIDKVRGKLAGMVFQDPLTSLNPTMKVGLQITEALYRREKMSASQCREEAIRLLDLVHIPDADIRADQYPHQFSGGMCQRIMIAMALAGKPKLLIADEPTTALDVTIQIQILKLIAQIRKEEGIAILLITHDFGVVANLADRVAVMYAGKIVETGKTEEVFCHPGHPYTKGLLESLILPDGNKILKSIPGNPPDLYAPPVGCAFAARCSYCMNICLRKEPSEIMLKEGHTASCWKLHPGALKGDTAS